MFSVYPFTHVIEGIYILCLIIIIKSEEWFITHCLGIGHATMVSAVCLSIFLLWNIRRQRYDTHICTTHTHTHTCNLLKPSRKWRCSWSSADRRCANYIWVINNFITYQGVSHVRDLTVRANLVNRVSWSRTSSYRQMFSWLRCITIFQ